MGAEYADPIVNPLFLFSAVLSPNFDCGEPGELFVKKGLRVLTDPTDLGEAGTGGGVLNLLTVPTDGSDERVS